MPKDHSVEPIRRVLAQKASRRAVAKGGLAAGLALAGAGTLSRWKALAQTPPPSGHITAIGWGNQQDIASQTAAVNKYMELFPQVKVDFSQADCGADFSACKTLIAGGNMPDVFVPGIWNYNTAANADVLEGVESYVQADGLNVADFNPKAIDSLKSLKDGKLYGLPMGFNCQSLYFNQDMFDKAGLAYPAADGSYTWDDVRAWAKKLTLDDKGNASDSPNFDASKITQWGITTLAITKGIPAFDHMLLAFGGSTMNLPDRQTCNLEHPDSIRA